jgi:tetratricopeptide (TPR) repeat protein
MKECRRLDLLGEHLRGLVRLIEDNSCFMFVCCKLRLLVARLYSRLYMLEDCERNLLFAELLSRTCLQFEVTAGVIEELARLYLKQGRVGEASQRAVSLLYLAVHLRNDELESRALGLMSVCYFYEGNISKSSFYYSKSLSGVDPEDRAAMEMAFDNAGHISYLERVIAGEKGHFPESPDV